MNYVQLQGRLCQLKHLLIHGEVNCPLHLTTRFKCGQYIIEKQEICVFSLLLLTFENSIKHPGMIDLKGEITMESLFRISVCVSFSPVMPLLNDGRLIHSFSPNMAASSFWLKRNFTTNLFCNIEISTSK